MLLYRGVKDCYFLQLNRGLSAVIIHCARLKALLLIIQNKEVLTDEAVDINTVLVSIIDINRKKSYTMQTVQ